VPDARGLARVDEIAAASPRLRALVFGPADFMASVGMRSLRVGAQPAGYVGSDAYHYPLLRILVAARAHGLAAIDGPYLAIGDLDGLAAAAASAAALGYDGKWVLHPGQIDVVNRAFSPGQDDYERAELILDAYRYHTTEHHRGAVMPGDEMIDEASRKLALVWPRRGARRACAGRSGSSRPVRDQPRTPHAMRVSASPLVRGRGPRSPGSIHRTSAASSPAASSPPLTVAA
jgi:citrate lyase subunit beta/citryl-CoA lyase